MMADSACRVQTIAILKKMDGAALALIKAAKQCAPASELPAAWLVSHICHRALRYFIYLFFGLTGPVNRITGYQVTGSVRKMMC